MKVIHSSGKRKTAIARATLKPGKGRVVINNVLLSEHTPKLAQLRIQEPLILAEDTSGVDISVKAHGGGYMAQADAIRLAIARALIQHNKKLEKPFLQYDRQLLVADVRRKEACKPNDSKARAKRQKSYR